MSGSRGTFSFRLNADAQSAISELRQLAGTSDEVNRAFQRLIQASPQLASVNDNVQRKMRDTATAMKDTGAAAKTAEAGVGGFGASLGKAGLIGIGIGAGIELFNQLRDAAIQAAQAIPEAGDKATQAVARLTALTGSAVIGQDSYTRIKEIAAATGSAIDDTVESFQRFRVAASDLGATSGEVLTLIENIQKFAVVNGISGQALSSATTQLAQALASGTLSGDELKSILENMPQLAQGLARELGVSVGRLREMGSEGKLTGDVVFPALQRVVAGVGAEFDRMPMSIGRARNAMDVAATGLLETLDQAFGLSGKVVLKFQTLAGIMQGIAAGVRTITQDERAFTMAKERDALREEVGAFDETITEARAVPFPDQDAIAMLVARRDALNRVLLAKDAEYERERRAAEEAAAADRLTRARAATKEIDDLDRRAVAQTEFDKRKKAIEDLFAETQDAALRDRQLALATKDYEDALAKLEPRAVATARAVATLNEPMSEFLKLRAKIETDARAVELALDPFAAAWEKAADQVAKLIAAMELFETSGGARGIDPARGYVLIARAQQNLLDGQDKLERGTDRTDAAFNQFFSNATSRAEEAITRFRSLGDVIAGVGEDLARLLIRTGITGPLSDAISGFVKDQGGASGLVKTGFEFVKSFFAEGGVMTDRGPLPLRRYASGGIADSPQIAMFGEGRQPEAYVPLPDGRRIPVAMQGGGGSVTFHGGDVHVNVANSNASPAQIAAVVRTAVEQSHRELFAEVNRGGATAKLFGRRR
jgi:tape measure domain-containing protein